MKMESMNERCSACGADQEGMDFCPKCSPALFQKQKERLDKKSKNTEFDKMVIFKWFLILGLLIAIINLAPLFFCVLFSLFFVIGLMSYQNANFKKQLSQIKPKWLPETDKLVKYMVFGSPVLFLASISILNDPDMQQLRAVTRGGRVNETASAEKTVESVSQDSIYETLVTEAKAAYNQKNKSLAYDKFREARVIKSLPSSEAAAVVDSAVYVGNKSLEIASYGDAKDAFELAIQYGAQDVNAKLKRAKIELLLEDAKLLHNTRGYKEFLGVYEQLKQLGFRDKNLDQRAEHARKSLAYEAKQEQQKAEEVALIGAQPEVWEDGSLPLVRFIIEKMANDPKSIEYDDWSLTQGKAPDGKQAWVARVAVRGKNRFNATVLDQYTFYIRHNEPVDIKTE